VGGSGSNEDETEYVGLVMLLNETLLEAETPLSSATRSSGIENVASSRPFGSEGFRRVILEGVGGRPCIVGLITGLAGIGIG